MVCGFRLNSGTFYLNYFVFFGFRLQITANHVAKIMFRQACKKMKKKNLTHSSVKMTDDKFSPDNDICGKLMKEER